ncbi:hypothetical protein [Halomonas sp. WWR20]
MSQTHVYVQILVDAAFRAGIRDAVRRGFGYWYWFSASAPAMRS